MKMFTVTTREWDGGSELHRVDRQVKAVSEKDARRRFRRWLKKTKWSVNEIVTITVTDIIH